MITKYFIDLDETGRIIAYSENENLFEHGIEVTALPEGGVSDYKYINNEYVYDPIISPEDDRDTMAVDHEYRITMIELGLTE